MTCIMDLEKIWKQTLNQLELQVSKANFHTLFKATAILSLEDNIATIAAPNTMVINLIQKRFLPNIKTALENQIKTPVDLIFVPKVINTKKNENQDDSGPLFSNK